jgi:hypothetical protein
VIYVFRKQSSTGARALSRVLNARRVFNADQFRPGADDTVVAWGSAYQARNGEAVLNGTPIASKFTDAQTLHTAGIPTVQVSRTQPPSRPAVPGIDPAIDLFEEAKETAEEFSAIRSYQRGEPLIASVREVQEIIARLQAALAAPVPAAQPAEQWLPRMNDHVGGNDLLNMPARGRADFFSKFEEIVEEYRVHSFDGRSIRAGRKIPRTAEQGFTGTPHPWIRSYEGGWWISYDNFESTPSMRELARAACEALHFDFGAVDIGRKANGDLLVLEVNRAPGLEGNTVNHYAEAINRWIQE